MQFVGLDVDAPPALGAEEDRCGAGKCAGNALGRLVFARNGTEDSSITVDGSTVILLVGASECGAIGIGIGTGIGVMIGNRDLTLGESDGTNDGCGIGYIQMFVGHPV